MKKFLFSIILVILLFSRPHYVEGDRSWTVGMKLPIVTVSTLPLCNAATEEARYAVSDGDTPQDCISGGGTLKARCICDGNNWIPELSGGDSASSTLQNSYDLEANPKIVSRGGGFTLEGFDSFANSFKLLDPITGQELRMGIDAAGAYFMTLKNGAPWITKLFSGFSWMLTLPNDSPIITADGTTGAVTVATSLAGTGSGTVTANRTSCTNTNVLKFDGTCMSDMVRVLDKVTTDVTVTNTTTATVVYSYSIPGGKLGTNSCGRLTVHGTILNNSAATHLATFRIRYGTTAAPSITQSLVVSATTKAATLQANVCNDEATNAQRLWGNIEVTAITPQSTQTGPAIDSTVNQSLQAEVELDTADANFTYVLRYAVLEFLP